MIYAKIAISKGAIVIAHPYKPIKCKTHFPAIGTNGDYHRMNNTYKPITCKH